MLKIRNTNKKIMIGDSFRGFITINIKISLKKRIYRKNVFREPYSY